jgi:hypothetical protein
VDHMIATIVGVIVVEVIVVELILLVTRRRP